MEASTKVILDKYQIEMEPEKFQTKLFVWKGEEMVGMKHIASLQPTKGTIVRAAHELIEAYENNLSSSPYLKSLAKEINAELANE